MVIILASIGRIIWNNINNINCIISFNNYSEISIHRLYATFRSISSRIILLPLLLLICSKSLASFEISPYRYGFSLSWQALKDYQTSIQSSDVRLAYSWTNAPQRVNASRANEMAYRILSPFMLEMTKKNIRKTLDAISTNEFHILNLPRK